MKYALGNMLNGAGSINPDGLALDLQFAADKTLTARRGPTPVFSRGSTGTFVGSNGLIQSAAINAPRFDHDPANPTVCRGLLIEEQRQNLVLQSENHPSASWNKTGVTISAVTQTAPDGNTNSNLVSEDSSTGLHRTFQGNAYVNGTSYAISVFLKFAGRQFVAITHPAVATNNIAIFDIQNGSVTLQQSGITASMVQYPNGWWRCVVVGTSSTTSSQSHIIQGSTTGGSLTGSYTGLNGAAFYIYGSQVEAGSFPTSYIPTTTSALTRSADVCSITGADFTNLWNTSEGTMFVAFSMVNGYSITGRGLPLFWASNNTFNDSVRIGSSTGSLSPVIDSVISGTLTRATSSVAISLSSRNKTAGAYKVGDNGISTNGSVVVTASPAAITTLANRLDIGAYHPASGLPPLNGHLAAIRYYKKRLPSAKLQALTA